MADIDGEHEPLCDIAVELLLAPAAGTVDAPQYREQYRGASPLLRPAADFLIIEERRQLHTFPRRRSLDALQAGVHRGEIIEPRRRGQAGIKTQHAALLHRIDVELPAQDILDITVQLLRQPLAEKAAVIPFCRSIAAALRLLLLRAQDQQRHFLLRRKLNAIIGLTVHMDGEIRDNTDGALEIHQPHHGMKRILACQRNPASQGQRTIQPWCPQQPAIWLDIQTAA